MTHAEMATYLRGVLLDVAALPMKDSAPFVRFALKIHDKADALAAEKPTPFACDNCACFDCNAARDGSVAVERSA